MSSADIDPRILRHTDVVVVAGGDGTIGRTATRLAATDIPLAIVPMGTANNVARSLGLSFDAELAVSALATATERRVDLGRIKSSGEETTELFIEGLGIGLFAHVLGELKQTAKARKNLPSAIHLIADELETYEAARYEVTVGDRKVVGSYVLIAAMNMRSVGPALGLAPDASCEDGELDVVFIGPESRDALVHHLRRNADGDGVTLPELEVTRARSVRVRGHGWMHADDRARELRGEIAIDVARGAVRILSPRACCRHSPCSR
jgi:diacylglycerol kinase family enzyme